MQRFPNIIEPNNKWQHNDANDATLVTSLWILEVNITSLSKLFSQWFVTPRTVSNTKKMCSSFSSIWNKYGVSQPVDYKPFNA